MRRAPAAVVATATLAAAVVECPRDLQKVGSSDSTRETHSSEANVTAAIASAGLAVSPLVRRLLQRLRATAGIRESARVAARGRTASEASQTRLLGQDARSADPRDAVAVVLQLQVVRRPPRPSCKKIHI